MDLSVVATLYCSSKYIAEFHRRISSEAQKLTQSYELIFVNDGSPDDSLSIARQICAKDPRVKVLDLSRNFGHHRAMMCGIRHAAGARVFLIDVDLEELPESLGRFWEAMEGDPEADVVVGELQEKTVSFFKQATSGLFYKVFNVLSSVRISEKEIVSRLMNRTYVNALSEYDEREIFFPAIWVDAGFKQKKIPATKTYDGNTSYTFRKRLTMAVEAITSFSNKPLMYIFYLGLSFSIGSLLFIIYLLMRKLLVGQVLLGWTSLMAVLFLIGGIIIFSLGVVGIYISKIYIEVKARPHSIVRKIYQGDTRTKV
jgi:putative glycosyltransferase